MKSERTDKRLVEGFDPEYNSLSRTLKMTLLLDEEALSLLLQTSATPVTTPQEISDKVLELLERSIYMNLPRKMQQGPHGET